MGCGRVCLGEEHPATFLNVMCCLVMGPFFVWCCCAQRRCMETHEQRAEIHAKLEHRRQEIRAANLGAEKRPTVDADIANAPPPMIFAD